MNKITFGYLLSKGLLVFDQSLSVKNFKYIYYVDRKNKGNLEKDYFYRAYELRQKIHFLKKLAKMLAFRFKQKKIPKVYFELKKERINKLIGLRKELLDNEISNQLGVIVKTVSAKGYSLPLIKSATQVRGKDVYSIGKDIETILVSRHIQLVLSSLYKVKVNNRDLIISRLSTLSKDSSPKYIIRADVENFYESVDHKSLLDILHSSPKLSATPRRILTQLIRSYANLTGLHIGLPRGVGISAYLSEVYMENIDYEIYNLVDVTYYERYVDDLIVIFSPTKAEHTSSYLPQIKEIINSRKLILNHKTEELDLFTRTSQNFDYLGYHFNINNGNCVIKLSQNKKDKIKKRLIKSFDDFDKDYSKIPRKACKNLLIRIRFLTGNTRLLNSKSNAFVGVYFSNKFITNSSDLLALDRLLTHKLSTLKDKKLRTRLSKMSFLEGFEKRIFRKFNIEDLSLVSKGWKNG